MTRFLLYTEDYPSRSPGAARHTGIGRYCDDLATGLRALGHTVAVLTADDGSATSGSPRDDGVERIGRTPRRVDMLLRRALLLRRRVVAFQPEYVLVGDPVAHQVAALASLPPALRVCPIFYGTELHGYRALLRQSDRHPARALRRRLLDAYLRRAYQPITISAYTARCFAELGYSAQDCIVFPAVSEPFLRQPVGAVRLRDPGRPHHQPPDGEVVRFITVARISERKNQRQVLEALDLLRRRDHVRWQYVIVGNVDADGHDRYFDSIIDLARERSIENDVLIVDRATDAEKIAWIDASDVFVMLSRSAGHSVEGFGISVIEASCRGKPVVVSDHGGMPETILAGETGFVVGLDSTVAIADCLLRLVRDAGLRRRLGHAGERFVREQFTPRHMAERLCRQLARREAGGHVTPAATYASPLITPRVSA